MVRLLVFGLACAIAAACISSDAADEQAQEESPLIIVSKVRPDPAYFEKRGELTRLNFDFELENSAPFDVEITFIGMRVYDAKGNVLVRRYMGRNGSPGPIAMLPEATIPSGGTRYIFNPFPDLALARAPEYAAITVAHSDGVLNFNVRFHAPPGPVLDRLPLDGISYVYSGNDLFAHHRRVALDSEAALSIGMEHVAQRYALDFTRLDPETGDLAANDGARQSDWYGFGVEVFAPVTGEVVAGRSDMPDNHFDASGQRVFADGFMDAPEDRSLGNYLTLEVGQGAYLVLAHFAENTLALEIGDTVEAGEFIGNVGMSGDTAYPHLHIQLQDGADSVHARPLPITFACVDYDGPRGQASGAVDTGDFVSPCVRQPARPSPVD
ncbi:MAG: M23 family metallopeptidase [Pseudomonadota bacterium]